MRRQLTDALRANSELEQELDASAVHEDTMEQTVSTLAERLGAAEAAVRRGRRCAGLDQGEREERGGDAQGDEREDAAGTDDGSAHHGCLLSVAFHPQTKTVKPCAQRCRSQQRCAFKDCTVRSSDA